ncbi:hypothetical protein AAFC00_001829 [Neodothiora populina]|uniref:Methyltransferase domain-containing protein n=1 Tax=Neodothiora populina TaxID=2781224 RepID=A0ABR3PQB1_9PEZI
MAGKSDNWSTEAYAAAASFVPKLATKVVSYLAVGENDHILDIGCGDGPLTAQIAASASKGWVLGLDASPNFITTAKSKYTTGNCTFRLQDCTQMKSCAVAINGKWDKVFSNAALHWILRNPDTRTDVFTDIHAALKPNGLFVCEFGGKGNIAEVHAAILSALVQYGVSIDQARESCPWFFPSEKWLHDKLQETGFEVEKVELENRPTKLTPKSADGSAGLQGWIKLMGAEMLKAVDEGLREQVVRSASEILETIITREEDGSQWIGYVRIRAVARKA